MKKLSRKSTDMEATLHLRLDMDLKSAIDGLIASNDGMGTYSEHVRRALAEYIEKRKRPGEILRAAEDGTEYKTPPPKRRPNA